MRYGAATPASGSWTPFTQRKRRPRLRPPPTGQGTGGIPPIPSAATRAAQARKSRRQATLDRMEKLKQSFALPRPWQFGHAKTGPPPVPPGTLPGRMYYWGPEGMFFAPLTSNRSPAKRGAYEASHRHRMINMVPQERQRLGRVIRQHRYRQGSTLRKVPDTPRLYS